MRNLVYLALLAALLLALLPGCPKTYTDASIVITNATSSNLILYLYDAEPDSIEIQILYVFPLEAGTSQTCYVADGTYYLYLRTPLREIPMRWYDHGWETLSRGRVLDLGILGDGDLSPPQ